MYQLTEMERRLLVDTLRAVRAQEDEDSVAELIDDSLELLEALDSRKMEVCIE